MPKKTTDEVKTEPVKAAEPIVATNVTNTPTPVTPPVQPINVTVQSPPGKSSSSTSCMLISCLAGCGCLIIVGLVLAGMVFFGGRAAIGMAKQAANGQKTTTGIPEPVIQIIEKFAGKSTDAQKFIQILREGLPVDATPSSTNENIDYNSEGDGISQ
jgi:hypothetical protein